MQQIEELLKKEYIYMDLSVGSQDELFEVLGGRLILDGYGKASYVQALKDREKKYPTALPTEEIIIAIPHTDCKYVNKSCICIAKLKEPIIFQEMGNNDSEVKVGMVFMLALNDASTHLNTLQKVISMFSNHEMLVQLKKAATVDEIYDLVLGAVSENN